MFSVYIVCLCLCLLLSDCTYLKNAYMYTEVLCCTGLFVYLVVLRYIIYTV